MGPPTSGETTACPLIPCWQESRPPEFGGKMVAKCGGKEAVKSSSQAKARDLPTPGRSSGLLRREEVDRSQVLNPRPRPGPRPTGARAKRLRANKAGHRTSDPTGTPRFDQRADASAARRGAKVILELQSNDAARRVRAVALKQLMRRTTDSRSGNIMPDHKPSKHEAN
jgi:hypothetical protein